MAAGSVDATALKADAITGKTITGGDIIGATVTGSEVRTGTSGERVVLTPTPPSPLVQRASMLLYSGATDELGPGVLNTGVTSGVPSTILASGATAVDGLGRQMRTVLGLIPPNPGTHGGRFVLDTLSPAGGTDPGIGRIYIDAQTATTASGQSAFTVYTRDGATTPKTAQLSLGTGRATHYVETLEVRSPATALAPLYLNAATGHTGNLLLLQLNAGTKFSVDAAGAVSATGPISAPSLAATGAVTAGSVSATGAITAAGALSGDTLAITDTTWSAYTPTVAGGGTATFTSRTGWYYKLGKLVYFSAEILVLAAGNGSAAVTITAPSSIHRGVRQAFPCHTQSTTTGGAVMNGHAVALEGGSGAVIDRISVSNDGAANRDNILNGTNLLAGARISISGWYREA
ncbi:hypothetical protein [Streptomyces microflavus]|uniref:hypothetical protein n=1 Tax=Streptomyces microflavus TaxID=1919 RepID=UPI003B212A6D